jgi:hypothetical protein
VRIVNKSSFSRNREIPYMGVEENKIKKTDEDNEI